MEEHVIEQLDTIINILLVITGGIIVLVFK